MTISFLNLRPGTLFLFHYTLLKDQKPAEFIVIDSNPNITNVYRTENGIFTYFTTSTLTGRNVEILYHPDDTVND